MGNTDGVSGNTVDNTRWAKSYPWRAHLAGGEDSASSRRSIENGASSSAIIGKPRSAGLIDMTPWLPAARSMMFYPLPD